MPFTRRRAAGSLSEDWPWTTDYGPRTKRLSPTGFLPLNPQSAIRNPQSTPCSMLLSCFQWRRSSSLWAQWNIYCIFFLKSMNQFCYSARTLSKKTVFRDGLNFSVEIRKGCRSGAQLEVYLWGQPEFTLSSSFNPRQTSIRSQSGKSGPKKFLPESDPR